MDEPEERNAKPWDLLDPDLGMVKKSVVDERLDLCKACDSYRAFLGQCKECGCLMYIKARLPNAFCPLKKWGAVR